MAQDPSHDAPDVEANDSLAGHEDAPDGDTASSEEHPKDFSEGEDQDLSEGTYQSSSSQTRLPKVVIGDAGRTSRPPTKRTLPGRVPPNIIIYPIYLAIAVHASFSARFASIGLEWNTGVVLIGALMIYGWNWMYSVSWSYQRTGLQFISAMGALGMEVAVLVLTLDRAREQQAATEAGLQLRAASPELYVSSGALAVAIALLVAHIVYLGRGDRERAK